jgi:hypothetical protein
VTAGAAGTAINSGSAGSATTSTNAGFAGAATTATSAGTAGTATNAGSAGTSVTAGSAGTAVNAGSATTATNSGFAGAATTATSAGTAGTATNAGFSGAATTATSAGTAGTAANAGTAGTATNAGSAGTATNSANTNIVLDTTSTIFLTGSRSNVSIASTAVYVLSGVSALGNTITATTFSGNATTATSAGTAGTATNAGSAGSATTATSAGTAGTATNAGSAGSATTATSAGTAGTATNAGSAGTSVTAGSATTATNAGTAGTATNAGSAGTSVTAGSATTATSAGTAGTASNAGSAGTSTNSANTNVVLDTTSTIYLTGSRSNVSIGNTPAYVLSGVSALGNTLSALGLNVTGSTASTSTSTGALIAAGGVGIGGSLWTSTTNFSSISGVGHLNSVITSGVWSGTAISAVNGGTGIASYTTGDILHASSSSTLARISAGTAGSVLTSSGAGSTPYWAAAALGSGSGLTLNGLTTSTQFFATSIAGSGFTIGSTGSTHTYYIALAGNASTGLISGAAQTIFGLKTFASGLAITSGAVSTNTTTGALTVAGGVGITGQLSVNTIALGSTSVSVTPSMVFTGSAGTVISMSVLSDTTLAWEGSSGQLFSIDNNLSSGEIFSVSDISGLPIISASAGQSIYLNEFGGFTQVGNGLASTNTTTGALRVIGGAGITGSLYLGSPLLIPSGGTGLTTYTTGDILHASSSTTLGRISAGTAGSILTSAGTGATPYWAAATGSTLAIAGTNNGDIQYKSASALGASSALNFDASTSTFKLTGFPIEAVSSSSANVKLLGGSVSWNGSINGTMLAINTANSYIGDLFNAQIGGTSRFKVSYTGAVSIGNSYTLPITDGTANQVLQTNGSGTVSWANSVISSAQYNIGYYASAGAALTGSSTFTNNTSTGVVSIGHTTSSTGFSTGALVVTGGVGVGGSSHFNNTLHITSSTASTNTTTGALIVDGGVGIGQTLNISGNIYQNTNAITAYDTGFRNRIINGDGNIDQRNSGSTTVPGVGAVNFIDRWKMNVFGSGRLTIGQNYGGVTAPDGFVSYIGMKTTTTSTPAANDYNFLTQMIEGSNLIDLQFGTANAKSFTISFWAYSSLTGTFGGSIRNSSATRSYPFTYTISSSNTWEKKTVVIPGDTTGTWSTSHLGGLEIIFVVSNGTTWQATPFAWAAGNYTGPSGSLVNLIGTLNATLYLTGIQVEIGSVATPYERRNYGHEFALCQRYYQITEVRTGGYHTALSFLRGSVFLNTAARPISSPVFTVLSTDESFNHGTLSVDNSNFRGDSFRYLVQVTTTGDAFGQWKVGADFEF